MKTLIPTLLSVLLLAALAGPAAADIDLAIASVAINPGGGGSADVVVVIDLRAYGPLSANTTDATLILDGVLHDQIWIDYSVYTAVGCTYYPNWQGLGPACVDEPGCDLWTINGQFIPGDCTLASAGVPIACYCSHPWTVIFTNVYLTGVSLLQVVVDEAQNVAELLEDNNVHTIESPVPGERSTLGAIKGLYR